MSPDITMCQDGSCPSAEKCYRFTAKESALQSFADFKRKPGEKKCFRFIEAISNSQVRRLDAQTEKQP